MKEGLRGPIEKHVLIGLGVKVLRHPDPSLEGLRGVIVWESTRAFVVLSDDGRTRIVLKDGGLFKLVLPSGREVEVEGKKLIARPYTRAKKR